jgi:hypothetical protein
MSLASVVSASGLAVAFATGAVLPAAVACADERHHAVKIDVGGSAVGFVGVEYLYSPQSMVEVETGVGLGYTGLQISFMPKLVLGEGRDHFVAGAGLSATLPGVDAPLSLGKFTTGRPIWLNLDLLGYEHRFDQGLFLSFALGLTKGLGGGRACELDCGAGDYVRDVSKFTGATIRLGLGYWF